MKKKILTLILTLVMVFTLIPAASITSSAATTGKMGSKTYCTVKINQDLINRKGNQYATVKINAKNFIGWRVNVLVTLRDNEGRFICSFVARGGDTIKLGDDHSIYRIYISNYDKPVGKDFYSRVIVSAADFGWDYASTWKVSNSRNCSVS